MPKKKLIEYGIGGMELGSAAINPDWILEGDPVARNKFLFKSADGTATTWLWDCTAGKFNWFYDIDETVYLIEGSVIIKDHAGGACRVSAGETIFFPAGSSAEWTVPNYVRKFAILRAPLPRQVQFAKRVYHSLKRLAGRGNGGDQDAAPKMFQEGG
jgi:uncharacterized cupin superfamily protein